MTNNTIMMDDLKKDSVIVGKKQVDQTHRLPKNLPRKRIEYDIPDAQKYCDCGAGHVLKKVDEEVFEQLDIFSAKMYVIEHVRFKYSGCASDAKVIVADMPRQPIEKSIAGPGLLADIVVKKYQNDLSLRQQSQSLARHAIVIAHSTLGDWLNITAQLLKPLITALKKTVLSSSKIHTDNAAVLVSESGANKMKTGRLWLYLGSFEYIPWCVIYHYRKNPRQNDAMEFLKGHHNYLQTDKILHLNNSIAKHLMRPLVMGQKNTIFAGSDQGAENAAIFYSLIETCRLHHINPHEYLREVFMQLPQLPSKIQELLPWNWQFSLSIA